MSLLSDLLAFSVFVTSNINPQSQPANQRYSRSVSADNYGTNCNSNRLSLIEDQSTIDDNNNNRRASKSLSKISLFANNSNISKQIDPKHRCLDRMANRLGMKVRKHYYSLFVVLQTMKKKGQTINQYQYHQKQSQKPIYTALNKFQQTFNIILYKQYEINQQKLHTFSKIKQYSHKVHSCKKIQQIVDKISLKNYHKRIICYCQFIQSQEIKFDVFTETIQSIYRKYQRMWEYENMKQLFQRISQTFAHKDSISKQQKMQVFISPPKKQHQKTQLQSSPNRYHSSDALSRIQQSQNENDENSYQSLVFKSNQKTPIKYGKKIDTLRQSLMADSIDQFNQNAIKAYHAKTKLNEQPIRSQLNNENIPNMMKKQLVHQVQQEQIGDLEDNSFLFRQFKLNYYNKVKKQKQQKTDKSTLSGIEQYDFSDAVGSSFLRIEDMINGMQRSRNNKVSESSIGCLPKQARQYSEINMSSRVDKGENLIVPNDLTTDFLPYTNKLISERQSFKKLNRDRVSFLKNKPTKSSNNNKTHTNEPHKQIAQTISRQNTQIQYLLSSKQQSNTTIIDHLTVQSRRIQKTSPLKNISYINTNYDQKIQESKNTISKMTSNNFNKNYKFENQVQTALSKTQQNSKQKARAISFKYSNNRNNDNIMIHQNTNVLVDKKLNDRYTSVKNRDVYTKNIDLKNYESQQPARKGKTYRNMPDKISIKEQLQHVHDTYDCHMGRRKSFNGIKNTNSISVTESNSLRFPQGLSYQNNVNKSNAYPHKKFINLTKK